jgi:hypothetical protein
MARISTYAKDATITGQDKLLGSNYGGLNNQGRPIFTTATYSITDLLTYFSQNITVGDSNISSAKIQELDAFKDNVESSVVTFNADGSVNTVSEAFANFVMTAETTTDYASASVVTNVIASIGTDDGNGNITISEAFANSIMTTETTTDYATASYVQNIGSSIGTVDAEGNITVSQSFANSVMTTENTTDYASAQSVTDLSSTVSNKPDIFRQDDAPATTEAVGSLWYDTNDGNKLYVLVAGTPNVWTETTDGQIGTLTTSLATANSNISTNATNIGNNATFATNLAGSFGTYDANGELTALSEAFANDVFSTTTSTNFAAATKVTELETQFTFDTNGNITGTSDTLASEITTAQSDAESASATKIGTLAANFFSGYDTGDGTYTSVSLANAVETSITTLISTEGYASANKVEELETQYTFDVNGNITGVSDTLDSVISTAQSNAESSAATKVETLAANFFTGYDADDGTLTDVSFSTAISDEISSVVSSDGYAAASDLETLEVTVEGTDGTGGLVGSVSTLQSTVASKPEVFRQDDAPAVTEPVGSLWFDTNDNNKAYVLVSGSPNVWTVTRDDGLISDIADKPFIFRQNDAPAVTNPVGSLWYDTNDGNKLYVLTTGAPNTWNATVDASIATAQDAADDAQATADARPKVFRQNDAPGTTEPEFSIWYDTDDNNKAYVLIGDGGNPETFTWEETLDGRVGDLLDFVESSYSLSTDANGVVTGMELYSRSSANSTVSEVKFTADRFIIKSSTVEATPFVLDNNALKLNVPLNGVSGSFSGSISAESGDIGGWLISATDLKSPAVSNINRLQLSPSAGFIVNDDDDDTALLINYGALSSLSSTTTGVTFADVSNAEVTSWDETVQAGNTLITIPHTNARYIYSSNYLTASFENDPHGGSYSYEISVDSITGAIATLTGSSDYLKATLALHVQIATDTSFNNVIKDVELYRTDVNGATTITFPGVSNKGISFSISDAVTDVYMRFYWYRMYAVAYSDSITWSPKTFNVSSADSNDDLVFLTYKGTTELTNEGVQIINDPTTFFKVDRSNFTSGNPYVDIGGDVKIDGDLQVTGNIDIVGDVENSDVSASNLAERLGEISTDLTIGASSSVDVIFPGNVTFSGTVTGGDVTVSNLETRLGEIDSNINVGHSSGVTITMRENVIVTGDLTVQGNTTTENSTQLHISDSLIHLADGNENSDSIDIGFVGHYSPDAGTTKQHAGIFRDADNGEWYLFNEYIDASLDSETNPTNVIDRSDSSFSLGVVNATTFKGGLTGDVTGNLTGDVTGDVTGNLTGNVTGSASLNVLKGGDTMSGDLEFNDNVSAVFGTGNDMTIYHSSTHSFIRQLGTGNLYIDQAADNQNIVFRNDNGSGGLDNYFVINGNDEKNVFQKTVNIGSGNLQIGGTTVINSSREFYVPQDGLHINALAVTTTAAELNILDGATVTTTELNKLDGYTGDATELNYAKSLYDTDVTATEFNYLDGVTSSIQGQINSIDAFDYNSYNSINSTDGYVNLFEMKVPTNSPKGGSACLAFVRIRKILTNTNVLASAFFNIVADDDGLITINITNSKSKNVEYKIIQDAANPYNYQFQVKNKVLSDNAKVEVFIFDVAKKGQVGSGNVITSGYSTYSSTKEHEIGSFNGSKIVAFDTSVTGPNTVAANLSIEGTLTVDGLAFSGAASSGGRTTETRNISISGNGTGATWPWPIDLASMPDPGVSIARAFMKFTVFGIGDSSLEGEFVEKKYVCNWNDSAGEWNIYAATEESSGKFDVQFDFTNQKFQLAIVDADATSTNNYGVTVTLDQLAIDTSGNGAIYYSWS